MKLKLTEDGKAAVVQDGKPVYVHDDGKEIAFDALATVQTLNRTLDESKKYKDRAQTSESRLKTFEGIEDPDAARKAIETLGNIDAGKLIAAGKVEEIKAAATKAAEERIAAAAKTSAEALAASKGENERLTAQLHANIIGGGFARSKLIMDDKHPVRLGIPADMVEARFGKNFKIEDGKPVGYDNNNNKIFSRAKPGELADFDEALETLVDQYPYKDQIIRGSGHRGDSARQGNGHSGGGKKTIMRSEFDKLDPTAQGKAAYGPEAMQIVDG